MNLPLVFGILTYLFILISLTAWLTKYHQFHGHGMDLSDQTKSTEENSSTASELISLPLKESVATTSGDRCPVQDDQGGAKK